MDSHDDDLDEAGPSLFGDDFVRQGIGRDYILDLREEKGAETRSSEDASVEAADTASTDVLSAENQENVEEELVPAGLNLFDREPGETGQAAGDTANAGSEANTSGATFTEEPEKISLDLSKIFAGSSVLAETDPEIDPTAPIFGDHKTLNLGDRDQSIFSKDGPAKAESTIAFVPAEEVAEPAWWHLPALALLSLLVVGFVGFQLLNLFTSPDGGSDLATVGTPATTSLSSTTVSELPTTLAPVSQAPTTAAPTTEAPATTLLSEATAVPTTAAGSTAAPTTRRPATTQRPATTAKPVTTLAPTTEAPVTTTVTTAAPTTAPPPTFGTTAPAPAPTTEAAQTTEVTAVEE